MKVKLFEYRELDSTNRFLKNNYLSFDSFTFVRTNYQRNGKGKFDAYWESEPNSNLTFSILIKGVKINVVEYLNWWVISSVTEVLKKYNSNIRFEQPNDFYFYDEKLGGLLIETKVIKDVCEYVVIGVGLNINQKTFKTPHAISLFNILGKKVNVNRLYRQLIKTLAKGYLL